jgi:hypothetical protein
MQLFDEHLAIGGGYLMAMDSNKKKTKSLPKQ